MGIMANHEEQENHLQQINKFIRMTYDYFLRPSEKVVLQLQRQIQLLSVEEDLSVFEPSSLVTLEFYTCLDQLMVKENVGDQVAWKAVLLVSHLAKSRVLLRALRDDINMIPVIGEYLQTEGLSHERYSKTLTLLQKLTRGVKIERREVWLQQLLPHLVQTVTSSIEATGDRDRSLLCPALATLNNLCRGNLPVVHCLLQWANSKRLLTVLLTKMQNCTQEVKLLTCECFLLIVSPESAVLNESVSLQVNEAMLLLFAVCKDGLAHGRAELVEMATDTLTSLACMKARPRSKKDYSQDLREVLDLNEKCSDSMLSKTAAFLYAVVSLPIALADDVASLVLQRAEAWMSKNKCSSWCLRLLRALLASWSRPLTNAQVSSFCSAALQGLERDLGDARVENVEHVLAAVRLLQELSIRNPGFHTRIELPPHRLTAGLQRLSEAASEAALLRQQGALTSRKITSSKAGLPHDSTLGISFRGADQSPNISRENRLLPHESGTSLLCSETIVRILLLVKQIAKEDLQYSLHCSQLLQQSGLMPHVMACQNSPARPLVALAVELLCDPNVSSESLEIIINMTCEQNRRRVDSETVGVAPAVGEDGTGMLLENGIEAMQLTNGGSDHGFSERGCSADLLNRVEELMARLKGIAETPEMRDVPLTDLVDLYEFKLANMAHTEEALQGLLRVADSKSRTLERVLLNARVESNRIRGMLRRKEERLQTVLTEARHSREKMAKEKVTCERESARLRGSLNAALEELAVERKKLQSTAADLAERSAELQSLQKIFEKERAEKEGYKRELDSLQGTRASLQKSLEKRTQENDDLEKVIKNLENGVAERDQKIEELTKVNQTLQKMKEVIHNISAGKQPF